MPISHLSSKLQHAISQPHANHGRREETEYQKGILRDYRESTRPQAHHGKLGLIRDESGTLLLARGGIGGVPPSPWELELFDMLEDAERQARILQAALKVKESEICLLRARLEGG